METNQLHIEGMSERDLLEGLSPEQLVDYKSFLLERYSDIEKRIHLVNDVLTGYGYTLLEDDTPDNVIYVDFQEE